MISDLESQIENAKLQIEICCEHGEKTEAHKWADKLRELVAQRTPERVCEMEQAAGLR